MAASRETYSIKFHWKYAHRFFHNRKPNILDRIHSVCFLLKRVILEKRTRKLFIEDNFNRPYNRLVGCKIKKKHRYIFDDDFYDNENHYFCLYCRKTITENDYRLDIRNKKIQKIRKR